MDIDLQPFCGKDEFRLYLMKPFSLGDFTYATDGRIIVRVSRRDGIGECNKLFDVDKSLQGIEQATFARPIYELLPQPAEDTECAACDGRGYEHDCPDCECECKACEGSGRASVEGSYSTTFQGVNFALRYVRKMLSLPGIEVSALRGPEAPWLFRFDGGVGALMPVRGPLPNQIEVFK